MTDIRDFVATLACRGKNFDFIQNIINECYEDSALFRSQFHKIIKAVKEGKCTKTQCGLNTLRRVRTDKMTAAIAADIEKHGQLTI